MRHLLVILLVCVGCVSSRLAEQNLEAVTDLGKMSVAVSQDNLPLAEKSVATAEEIVTATGTIQQILHLGVPEELIVENEENVEKLGDTVDLTKPNIKMGFERAVDTSKKLAEEQKKQQEFKDTTADVPYVDTAKSVLSLIATGIGLIYGATRGQKHVRAWWGEPTAAWKKKQAAPAPAPAPAPTA